MNNLFLKWKQRYSQRIALGFALWMGTISQVAVAVDEYTIKTIAGIGQPGCSNQTVPANKARIQGPRAIVLDRENQGFYIFEELNHTIRYFDNNSGDLIPIAGVCGNAGDNPDNTHISQAKLNRPVNGKVFDGELYFTEFGNHKVRKIDKAGYIHTIVGNGTSGFSGDGDLATKAQLVSPAAVEIVKQQLFIADEGAHCIRVVSLNTGIIKTFLGICGKPSNKYPPYNPTPNFDPTIIEFNSPRDIVSLRASNSDLNLFISDTLNRRVVWDTQIRTGWGPYLNLDYSNPPPQEAIGIDGIVGSVIIADKKTHRIFEEHIDGGRVYVLAGTGKKGYNGDQIDATSADLNEPHDVASGWSGEIYIADTGNNRVRVLDHKPYIGNIIKLENSYGRAPLTVTLTSNAFDNYGSIEKYQWISSPDDQKIEGGTDKKTVKFTFNQVGTYTVDLIVTDDNGGSRKTTSNIITVIENQAPIPIFQVTPTSGDAPLSVNASAQGSYDPEKDPITYEWKSFQQGQTTFTSTSGIVPNQNWNFTFNNAGTHCIVLVVRDNQGGKSESQPQCVQVGTPGISLVLAMNPKNTSTCGTFNVVIAVKALNGQQFETVRAILDFEPQHLQVDGVKHGAVFDFTPKPTIDNKNGSIDLRASVMLKPNKPTGVVDLMTITFRPTNPNQQLNETLLTFDLVNSTVIWKGQKLLKSAPDIKLTAVGGGGEFVGIAKLRHLPKKVIDKSKLGVCILNSNPKIQTSTNTDNRGKFKLNLVPANTYDIYVSQTNTLQKKQSVSITACQANNINFYLSSGDVAGLGNPNAGDPAPPDNKIDSDDVNAFIDAYGVANYGNIPLRRDYNLDGQVTDADVQPDFYRSHFDLNQNGKIDNNDAIVFMDPSQGGNFGEIGDSQIDCKKGEVWKNIRSIKSSISRTSKRFSLTSNEVKLAGSQGSFDVVIKANEAQPINVITAYFNFDPESLQINAVKAGNHFDTVLAKTYDNSTGQIAFRVMHLGKEKPQGTFSLMTIDFTLLKDEGEQTLTFDVDRTRILSRNGDLPDVQVQATVQDNIKPLLIDLFIFSAVPQQGGIFLSWLTDAEINNAGFNVLRSEERTTRYIQLNNNLIPTQAQTQSNGEGATYHFIDDTVIAGKIYYYKLQDIDFDGTSTLHGPITFITIHSPADNAILTSTAVPTFEWLSDTNQENILEYSYDEEVYEIAVNDTTFTPPAEVWQAFAKATKGRTVFWRVVNNETVSEIRQFTIVNDLSSR